jgi:flavin reductase (DIM6/NTAB) family NADH-FMN oxidoreductase RutF
MIINPKDIKPSALHGYLLGAVAPRPIAFASTVDKDGNPNLSPFSFFNVFSSNPPVMIFSPARSGRTGKTKDTYDNIKDVPEVVINVVSYNIVQQASLASTEYEKGTDEFKKAGLTPLKSEMVTPFRVKESPVQMECKVTKTIELGTGGGAGNLVFCELLLMHIDDAVLDANKAIDPHLIDLVARMGGNFYCRASGKGVFEVEKPLVSIGIGVDQIPFNIRNSKVLTGNNLGQLGNVQALPGEKQVREFINKGAIAEAFEIYGKDKTKLEDHLHHIAKRLLEENKVEEAWKVLLAIQGEH